MAEYIPPDKNNIPFNFTTGGYQPPDFDKISVDFTPKEIQQQMANLGAAIIVMPQHSSLLPATIGAHQPQNLQALIGSHPPQNINAVIKGRAQAVGYDLNATIGDIRTYQQHTYTFLKYCEQYIVGYSHRGVQIIKGRCHYGGIRDIGAVIGGHSPGDLPAWIAGLVYKDLSAEIIGDPATQERELSAWIGMHPPVDLGAIIDMHQPEDLSGYIRGFAYKELPAIINILLSSNLTGIIGAHLPEDLSSYLKVWPMSQLPGRIHGWDTKDLGGLIGITYRQNLPAIIAAHRPRNLGSLIKGWVREATHDLGASVHSFIYNELPAEIRGTDMRQLPAYLFAIAPVDLPGRIHGWDTKDLQGIITVAQYPWNLPASITGRPWKYKDLGGSIISNLLPPHGNLMAYILVTQGVTNLTASLSAVYARNLGAYIDPGKDITNLRAMITPKTMRLTGILSVITMEHDDLSATINIPCFYTGFKMLYAYIKPIYISNLGAQIIPQDWVRGIGNLGAKWGYQDVSVVQDKLSITFTLTGWDYRTEDKLRITASVFRSGLSLGAIITPQRLPVGLSAYIYGLRIAPYSFDAWKLRERVQDRTYSQVATDYEDVDISFESIVRDYFYSSGSDVVAKTHKYEHFVTKVASYYSPAKAARLNSRLHKIKYLYDLRLFDSIDEAMKAAIEYVTSYPERNLGAYIESTGGFINLTSSILGKDTISTNTNLNVTIEGEREYRYNVAIGYTDDGVGYLTF